jgi:hypothetical protein
MMIKTNLIVQIYEIQTPREAEKLIGLGVDHIGRKQPGKFLKSGIL